VTTSFHEKGWCPRGPGLRRAPARARKLNQGARLLPAGNHASGAPCYVPTMASAIFNEIRTRLEMTEANVERMRRAVPVASGGSPDRRVLLRQLEIAAAVAGELESLLSLVGHGSARSPYALVQS
jgi:hypothetical protein